MGDLVQMLLEPVQGSAPSLLLPQFADVEEDGCCCTESEHHEELEGHELDDVHYWGPFVGMYLHILHCSLRALREFFNEVMTEEGDQGGTKPLLSLPPLHPF